MEKALNFLGIIFSIWFLLTAWVWTYNAALFISYPIGIIALLILIFSSSRWGKKVIKTILLIGFIASTAALFLYK
ncbi:hypothetical protein [Pedobacter rhizosphaerae]|uniref:Uncharacterized protein n=1 Tax=Pedobacter rhizosphaerae TaxID=390241 RepID=A0A1H9S9K9_9SPHI|nr:hypothetical protein [Pedobacter rhizosphaerae]SER81285.1 hypothetical protein SAMN04488023_11718 [Pedobacter rhizosphaerae]